MAEQQLERSTSRSNIFNWVLYAISSALIAYGVVKLPNSISAFGNYWGNLAYIAVTCIFLVGCFVGVMHALRERSKAILMFGGALVMLAFVALNVFQSAWLNDFIAGLM